MTDKETIYLKVGQLLNVSQAIEYNLHYIIIYDSILKTCMTKEDVKKKLSTKNEYYERLSKESIGNSLDLARKTKIFTEDFLTSLSKAVHSRNYYAHRFFKDDFEKNEMNNNPKKIIEKLDRDLNRLNDMNNELCNDLNTLVLLIKKKIQ